MNLDADDFTLFNLPRQFAQDRAAIDARWKALQAEVHPDRFAAEGPGAQRVAMQWAVRVNEAYQRLKNPLKRAAYLCDLGGAPVQAESNTAMPADFLMRQMEWRERLEESRQPAQLETLHDEVTASRQAILTQLGRLIDELQDLPAASAQVRGLMFVEKFAEEVERRLDALDT